MLEVYTPGTAVSKYLRVKSVNMGKIWDFFYFIIIAYYYIIGGYGYKLEHMNTCMLRYRIVAFPGKIDYVFLQLSDTQTVLLLVSNTSCFLAV